MGLASTTPCVRRRAAGALLDHDDVPGRTDYELTEPGEGEFMRLLRDVMRRPQPRPDLVGAALAMLPALPRHGAIRPLPERLAAQEATRDKAQIQVDAWTDPPHVRELFGLWEHYAAGGADWTRGLIGRLERRDHPMAGEPGFPGTPGKLGESPVTRRAARTARGH